jgi:hypothetical protein
MKDKMKSGSSAKSSVKTDVPAVPDSKTSPPISSIADLVESVGLGRTGVSEVLSAGSPVEMVRQTVVHPVFLAVVVGGLLMAFGGGRR